MAPTIFKGSDYACAHAHFDRQIDVLNELYNSIAIQQRRLGIGLMEEQKRGALSSATSNNMKLLFKLLTSTLRLEIDIGLRSRQKC